MARVGLAIAGSVSYTLYSVRRTGTQLVMKIKVKKIMMMTVMMMMLI